MAEGQKTGISLLAIVDSNCDPTEITYPIPGNDDAIRAIRLLTSRVADAVLDGKKLAEERRQAMSDKELAEAEVEAEVAPVVEAAAPEEAAAAPAEPEGNPALPVKNYLTGVGA